MRTANRQPRTVSRLISSAVFLGALVFLSAVYGPRSAATELPARALFFPSGPAAPAPSAAAPESTAPAAQGIANFLYVSPNQWSFWWRGQRIAADAVPAAIRIVSVTPAAVQFTENGQEFGFEVGTLGH